MTGKQLKNAILQLAIQGKLVPQNPADEPASVLLAKIRKEKEQLVKEGKLKKKDLATTPITEDEKPFEIPESWEWVRLGEIGIFERGNGIKRDETFSSGKPCVRYGEMYTKYRYSPTFEKTYSFTTQAVFEKCRKAHCGDLFMALTGENKQDIALAAQYTGKEEIAVGGDLCHFSILQAFALYFVYLINSQYFSDKKELLATGDIIVHISADKLGSIPIPLPPLAEQRRIVAKIEELMPLVEEYGEAQEKLNRLNAALPEMLKKSILQQAIQGKLVQQNPTDEPASALLAKIRKEKEKLVKEGKLKKKDLATTPITDEEKPFEIPESWEWCRLKDICTKIVDGDHNPPSGLSNKTEYLMLSSKNVNFDRLVDLDSVRYLSKEIFEVENQRTDAKHGDILFTSVGTLGRSCIIEHDNLNICFQRSVSILTTLIYNKFLKRCLDSPFIQSFVIENATGTAQKGFYLSQMEKLIIPLPPLAEQRRIVAKVEELFKVVEGMR